MKIGDHFFYHTKYPDQWLLGKLVGDAAPDDFGRGYSYRMIAAHISNYSMFGLKHKNDKIGQVQVGCLMWQRMELVIDKKKIIKAII